MLKNKKKRLIYQMSIVLDVHSLPHIFINNSGHSINIYNSKPHHFKLRGNKIKILRNVIPLFIKLHEYPIKNKAYPISNFFGLIFKFHLEE